MITSPAGTLAANSRAGSARLAIGHGSGCPCGHARDARARRRWRKLCRAGDAAEPSGPCRAVLNSVSALHPSDRTVRHWCMACDVVHAHGDFARACAAHRMHRREVLTGSTLPPAERASRPSLVLVPFDAWAEQSGPGARNAGFLHAVDQVVPLCREAGPPVRVFGSQN
jgi:hypothetical protein